MSLSKAKLSRQAPQKLVRHEYLDLGRHLDLAAVGEAGLRLTAELVGPQAGIALLDWETGDAAGPVLVANEPLPPVLLDTLPMLQDSQTILQAGPGAGPDFEADLTRWLADQRRYLVHLPLTSAEPATVATPFRGGLLIWLTTPPADSLLDDLADLAEALLPALSNAAEHERVLNQYRMLETVRKTWEQVWVSVDEQQRAIERMLARNQALHDIGLAINSSLNLKEILNTIMRETVRLVGAGRGAIALWDNTRHKLTLMAEYHASGSVSPLEMATDSDLNGPDEPDDDYDPLLGVGQGMSEEIAEQALGLRRFLKRHWKLAAGHAGAILISPLRWQKQTVGAIILNDLTPGRIFAREDVDIVTLIASQATVAIENARLFDVVAQERNRSRAILDSIADGVFTADLNQRITSVNPGAERLSGYDATALLGRVYLDALDMTDRNGGPISPDTSPFLQAVQDGASTAPRIYQIKRGGAENEFALIALVATPILDDRGTITGTVGVFRDVTQEQAVSRLKDELVSLVSHELRTPMASVLGFSELMLTRQLSEAKSRMYVETIYKEAQRLSNLINDFLDVQRMESGRQVYNYIEVDLKPILRQISNVFSRERGRLKLDIPPHLPAVQADPDRIVQTLTNLVSNGLKYSPDGGDVIVRARLNEQNFVEIAVQDHGLGIPREAQPHLFTKFYRVDNSDRREIGGTGLGLAISREIVEAHGGKIWLESEPGHGSTFYFTLPAVRERVSPDGPLDGAAGAQSDERLVLVVEDDQSLANLITAHLEEDGYRVEWSATAEQASLFLEQTPRAPAIIVLDIVLPGRLDGWDFLLQLKANSLTVGIPVIISTVLDSVLSGSVLGEATFLPKPLDTRRLLETINRLTAVRPQRNVLLIDDDASLRRMLKETLTAQDFVVATAAGGEQGLKLALQNLPDLVILDLMMPRMDGFQVVARLRSDRRTMNVPVVAVSAKELTRSEGQFLHDGTAHFLTKGEYTPQRIRELVGEILRTQAG